MALEKKLPVKNADSHFCVKTSARHFFRRRLLLLRFFGSSVFLGTHFFCISSSRFGYTYLHFWSRIRFQTRMSSAKPAPWKAAFPGAQIAQKVTVTADEAPPVDRIQLSGVDSSAFLMGIYANMAVAYATPLDFDRLVQASKKLLIRYPFFAGRRAFPLVVNGRVVPSSDTDSGHFCGSKLSTGKSGRQTLLSPHKDVERLLKMHTS